MSLPVEKAGWEMKRTTIAFRLALVATACLLFTGTRTHADNIFVSSSGNSTIEKFDSNGNGVLFVDSSLGLSTPTGLAFDRNDTLYAAYSHSDTIEKFDSSGNGTVFAHAGLTNAVLDQPLGLAFDSSGNLFVANFGSNGHPGLWRSSLRTASGRFSTTHT